MATRTILDSLKLYDSSMNEISDALQSHGVAGTTKLSEVADKIRAIQLKGSVQLTSISVSSAYKPTANAVTIYLRKDSNTGAIIGYFKWDPSNFSGYTWENLEPGTYYLTASGRATTTDNDTKTVVTTYTLDKSVNVTAGSTTNVTVSLSYSNSTTYKTGTVTLKLTHDATGSFQSLAVYNYYRSNSGGYMLEGTCTNTPLKSPTKGTTYTFTRSDLTVEKDYRLRVRAIMSPSSGKTYELVQYLPFTIPSTTGGTTLEANTSAGTKVEYSATLNPETPEGPSIESLPVGEVFVMETPSIPDELVENIQDVIEVEEVENE